MEYGKYKIKFHKSGDYVLINDNRLHMSSPHENTIFKIVSVKLESPCKIDLLSYSNGRRIVLPKFDFNSVANRRLLDRWCENKSKKVVRFRYGVPVYETTIKV